METTILDELLSNLKNLEISNQELREKLKIINAKLDAKKGDNVINEKGINLEDEMIVDDQSLGKSDEYLMIIQNRDSILQNVKEQIITYIPYEQYANLWIMGDFTDWEPIQMNKNKDIYTFNVVLIKGYKYYFSFTERNQVIVDFNQDYENNPRSGQVNNFINFKTSEHSDTVEFDYKVHSNLLKLARKNLTKARMENEDEVTILENMVDLSGKLTKRITYLSAKKDEIINKIRKYYEKRIDIVKNSDFDKVKILSDVFKQRVIEYELNLYYIDSIDITENCVLCMKLYDKNGIKINLDYYKKTGNFMKFHFKDLEHHFKIFTTDESQQLLLEYQNSKKILSIFYILQPANILQTEGIVYLKSYGNKLMVSKVFPEELNITDYDIDISGSMILDVRIKADNLKVIYHMEEVKDERGNLPMSLQIYYSYFKKTLNIIHVHYLDPEISIHKGFDAYHLEKNEDPNTYKIYNDDYKHRIRILFKNYKIFSIFYLAQKGDGKEEVIELRSGELNLKIERILKIECDSYFNNFYCKIKKIPVYQLALLKSVNDIHTEANDYTLLHDRTEICKFSTEDTHELNGLIDIEILFDSEQNLLYEPINISIPVCKLSFIPVTKEMDLEKLYMTESRKRKSDEISKFDQIYSDVTKNFEQYLNNKDSLMDLSKEEIKKAFTVLKDYKDTLPNIGKYVERNELWHYLEKIYIVESIISSVITLLDEHLSK